MGVFDNATSVVIGNKEVQSIVLNDGGVLYEKPSGTPTMNITFVNGNTVLANTWVKMTVHYDSASVGGEMPTDNNGMISNLEWNPDADWYKFQLATSNGVVYKLSHNTSTNKLVVDKYYNDSLVGTSEIAWGGVMNVTLDYALPMPAVNVTVKSRSSVLSNTVMVYQYGGYNTTQCTTDSNGSFSFEFSEPSQYDYSYRVWKYNSQTINSGCDENGIYFILEHDITNGKLKVLKYKSDSSTHTKLSESVYDFGVVMNIIIDVALHHGSITLSSDKQSVNKGEVATLSATLTDDGTPMEGETINFYEED